MGRIHHSRSISAIGILLLALAIPTSLRATSFRRGDVNGDGLFDIGDAVSLLGAMFGGSASPACRDAADANDNGSLDISDAIFILGALFTPGSPLPPSPGLATCGEDPTPDGLGCDSYPPCGTPCTTCYRLLADGGVESFELCDDALDCVDAGGFADPPPTLPRDLVSDEDPPLLDGPLDSAAGRTRLRGGPSHAVNVELATGELVIRAVDLVVPGVGIDFVLSRTYRSRIARTTVLGPGWAHAYDLRIEDDGAGRLVLLDGGLRRDEFAAIGGDEYRRAEYLRRLAVEPGVAPVMDFGDGSRWTFRSLVASTAPGRIAEMRDADGNRLAFDYDALDRLVSVLDTRDRTITFAYDPTGRLASVTDFTGRSIVYDYYASGDPLGSAGDLRSVTAPIVVGSPTGNDFPAGVSWVYTYATGSGDPSLDHDLTSITDPRGLLVESIEYGMAPGSASHDRVTRRYRGGAITDITYEALTPVVENAFAVRRTIENDGMGNVRHLEFDASGHPLREVRFTGRAVADQPTTSSTNRPDFASRLRSSDPQSFTTEWRWDGNSRPVRERKADGRWIDWTVDSTTVDARSQGNVTRVDRHAIDDASPPLVETARYPIDRGPSGYTFGTRPHATTETDASGRVTTHTYDAVGHRIRTDHPTVTIGTLDGLPQPIVEEWEYDDRGRLTRQTDPGGLVTDYGYYPSGPMEGWLATKTVDPLGLALTTTYETDALGRVTRIVDPIGRDTLHTYDALDRWIRSESPEATAGVRVRTDRYYDATGHLVRTDVENRDASGALEANAAMTTVHVYDALGRRVRTVEETGSYTASIPGTPDAPDVAGLPDSEFRSFVVEYDANGHRSVAHYGEAAEGRTPEEVERQEFDERDLLFRTIRGTGVLTATTQFDYDGAGRRVVEREGLESTPRVWSTIHDAHGRSVEVVDP
ncbi:MAG: hypothetical protein KDC38_03085, partial [Planctomycetes bacterium]|nr:hypothetical protein [Planctomycetota bacterium]